MNNHFSGGNVDEYLEENGYKAAMTRKQGQLHKGLKKYMQHKVKVEIRPMLGAARFKQPIIAVKEVKFQRSSGKKE